MALKSREAMRVLLNAPQVRGRVLSFYSCYFHQQQCLLQLHNYCRNKVYSFQSFSSGQDTVLPERKGGTWKTKSGFMKEFDNILSKGNYITFNQAYYLLDSCGHQMVFESNLTKNELVRHVWNELEENVKSKRMGTGLWNVLMSVYIQNGCDVEPLSFLHEMQQKNVEPNQSTFELLLRAFAVKGDPVSARKVVKLMIANNGRMTEDVYGCLMMAYAKNEDMDNVEEILRLMRKNNTELTEITYSNLINIFSEQGDMGNLENTFKMMIEHDCYPTSQMYIDLLDHLSRGGHTDLIGKVLTKIEDTGPLFEGIATLIERCLIRGEYEAALILLEHINALGEKEMTFDGILTHLLTCGENHAEEASAFIKGLVEKGIPVRSRNYTRALKILYQHDMVEQFFLLIHIMIENGIEPDIHQYHILLRMTAKIGNGSVAQLCFNKLHASEEFPKKGGFYCNLIRAYAKDSESGKESANAMVVHYYTEMIGKSYKPDNEINKLAVRSYLRSGDVRGAIRVAKEEGILKEIIIYLILNFNADRAVEVIYFHNLRYNIDVINGTLTHLVNCEENYAEEALTFFKGLVEKVIPVNSTSYTCVLKILNKHNMHDQLFALVHQMKENGIDADVQQYYTILETAVMTGNSSIAQLCFDKLNASDECADKQHLYTMLIKTYSKEGSESQDKDLHHGMVVHYYNKMVEEGYMPSNETNRVIIKSYLHSGDVEGAHRVVEGYGDDEYAFKLKEFIQHEFAKVAVKS